MRASASSSGSARPWRGSFGGSYDRLGLALEILWHIFRAPLKRAPCPYLSTDATRLETYRIRDDALFPQDRYAEAGREFVEVLNRAAPLLADSTIILAPSIPGCRAATDRFSSAVDAAIADGLEQIPNRVAALRVDADLRRSHCFVLDNHLNASGHALYARKISEVMLDH